MLLYELLTGRPPFDGDTPHEVLTAQVLDPPVPVSERRPDTPAALAALVMRALQKDPAARWATADELLPQLDGLATPSGGVEPVPAAPAPPARWGRWLANWAISPATPDSAAGLAKIDPMPCSVWSHFLMSPGTPTIR